jgi:hypothetical protein
MSPEYRVEIVGRQFIVVDLCLANCYFAHDSY